MKLPDPLITPYSDAWYEARRGKITASERLHVVLYGTPRKRNELLDELEMEIDIRPARRAGNKYMNWGKANEPICRNLIENEYGVNTVEPGLVVHAQVPILAATPDYWVLDEAGDAIICGEMKCPYYLKWQEAIAQRGLRHDLHPDWMQKYYTQVQGQALISATPVSWFSTYHPEAEPKIHLEVVAPDLTLHARMLESCADMADKLQRGARFRTGVTRSADGVPQVF